jgi:hypothetical protein
MIVNPRRNRMTDTTTPEAATLSFVHPGELHEAPDNPRFIRDERFDALKHALKNAPRMMLARPVIADTTRGGEVIAGNMRLRAAAELIAEGDNGYTAMFKDTVPTFLYHFPGGDTERREWMLRDNAPYGSWEALAALVKEHENDGGDMSLLGFDTLELDRLVKEADAGDSLGGDGGVGDEPPTLWGVVVECDDEETQSDLLEELAGRGLTVRALL